MNNTKESIQSTDVTDGIIRPDTPPFPHRLTVELTNHCNLKCTMCPRMYMESARGFMPMPLFKKIIDEISRHNNIALVPFFRGESLLHPEFIEMMKYVKIKEISPVQLTTNATIMTEDIARTLIDIELDFISFSVDSVDYDTYRNIRKGADLHDVLKNIERFSEIKKERGRDKPEIQVSVVKTAITNDSIAEFVEYWQGHVDRVRIYEEHSQGGNFGSLSGDCKVTSLQKRQPCLKPFNDLIIYWDGSVALCNHDWNRRNAIGNVNDYTIEEIWHNAMYRMIRAAHVQNNSLLEELCRKCDHWKAHYLPQQQIGDLYVRNSKETATVS